jgi:hypothetical protein
LVGTREPLYFMEYEENQFILAHDTSYIMVNFCYIFKSS